jgi:acetylornithine deacetylase/succinyl-diaminopimelate desuccinylase-like protein
MTNEKIKIAIDYAHDQSNSYIEGFHDFLRMPSVSTDPKYKADLERCADWVVAEMSRIGFNNSRKIETEGQPVVYGEWLEAGDNAPTLLVYAHYDVQPIDPIELWDTDPFEPTMHDGKLYARGVIDDKCGVWINLKAFESMFQTEGKLPVNVKLFFEGEEECGSPNMEPFVKANKELLAADALILCDGDFSGVNPKQSYSARGVVAAQVTITGPDHDLHSGAWGGAVHNPLHHASKIIASFHDDEGRIAIQNFYDSVKKLSDNEYQAMMDVWEQNGEDSKKEAGVDTFWGGAVAPMPERLTALPTLDINGLWGGYQDSGVKTIIPSKAEFKVTMRTVADMNPADVAQLFTDHVMSFAVDTLEIDVKILVEAFPFTMQFEGALIDAAQDAYQTILGKTATLVRGGGSVPIGGMLQNELNMEILSFGFGSGANVHSPNEYMNFEDFQKAMDTAIHFYYKVADTMQ